MMNPKVNAISFSITCLVICAFMGGCATKTHSLVSLERGWTSKTKEDKVLWDLHITGFKSQIDNISSESIPADHAKIVIFRPDRFAGKVVTLRFTINEYAFADVGVGECFSLTIPAGKNIDLGIAMYGMDNNYYSFESLPLIAEEGKVYFYELSMEWQKAHIVEIESSTGEKYFMNGFKSLTTSYKIDWDAFFDKEINEMYFRRALDRNGEVSVMHYKALSHFKF